MRGLFYSFLGYFLTPLGVVAMGALDSSLVFFLPLGIDFVVIILAARKPELFWLYALLATVGSWSGRRVTFWLGRKVGEHGIAKLVKPSRLKRIQQRISERAAYSVAALAIIPPPFPFTAFVLTSGAFRVPAWSFFGRWPASGCCGSASKRAGRPLRPRDPGLDEVADLSVGHRRVHRAGGGRHGASRRIRDQEHPGTRQAAVSRAGARGRPDGSGLAEQREQRVE